MASKYFYRVIIRNEFLGESKEIGAHTKYDLEMKVAEQKRKWNEKVQRRIQQQNKEQLKNTAERLTINDEKVIKSYSTLLNKITKASYLMYYNSLLDESTYREFESKLKKPGMLETVFLELGVPKKSFLEVFSSKKKEYRLQKEKEAAELLQKRYKAYEKALEKEKEEYQKAKEDFLLNQAKQNSQVKKLKELYEHGDEQQIENYFKFVLNNSKYPNDFVVDFDLQYLIQNKTIVVSYFLPNSDFVPKIIQHKYVASKNKIEEIYFSDRAFKKFYNDIIYMVCLRSIKELFISDDHNFIDNVVFNGWIKYVDKSNGQECESCVLTVEVPKEKFLSINLSAVEYKECIKGLKGIFAPDILTLTPVVPYLNINRDDSRFIESKEVSGIQMDGFNLATMPWEDFEYFVRELFDKMFNVDGGEVKVTQASHDGGVDAIAFDDDPIRGGKFVIQAKRYNNVVPVSAVRDLYGTMIHEGATKGILVTTSFYGKEAYDFAKDKPITLIDGQALLGLLNKYGYDKLTIKISKNNK